MELCSSNSKFNKDLFSLTYENTQVILSKNYFLGKLIS